MYKRQQKTVIALFVISVMAISLLREGYAAPTVIIRAIPNQTEVYAGTGEILFTAHVRGLKNVTYTWKLIGPGRFEGDIARSAIFYIPPNKIDKQSVKVIVAVTVSDETGQQIPASVPLTIVKPTPTPTPTPNLRPTPTPTPGDAPQPPKMSKVTKIALGLGAAAALGGGIILATGGDETGGGDDSLTPTPDPTPTPTCTGVIVGGYCWHLGAQGQSCNDVCAPYGGYHEATQTYAGSGGTAGQCEQVLDDLDAPASDWRYVWEGSGTCGCYVGITHLTKWVREIQATTAECAEPNFRRACACNW